MKVQALPASPQFTFPLTMIVRPQACEACPYRRDVASGVWAREEYEKLPPYDADTGEQPMAGFVCHASPGCFCHGWAVVGGHDLLALRFHAMAHGPVEIPPPSVPLFASSTEAAAHGLKQVKRPTRAARATMARLQQKHRRLRISP